MTRLRVPESRTRTRQRLGPRRGRADPCLRRPAGSRWWPSSDSARYAPAAGCGCSDATRECSTLPALAERAHVFDGSAHRVVMERMPARTGAGPRRIRRFVRSMIYGLAFLILTDAVAAGQDRPTFSAASELVVLHVNVKDRNGAYVTNLTPDAFAILEDGH